MRAPSLIRSIVIVAVGFECACGSSAAQGDAAGRDANDDADVTCAHDPFPTVTNQGGPVLAAPEVVFVTFADDPNRATLDAFSQWIPTSDWLSQVGADYRVSRGSVAGIVHLATNAPASIDDADIQTWLASSVDDGTLPTPPGGFSNALYVVYYPATTSITRTRGSMHSCFDFAGYHGQVTGHVPAFAYAVVPNCTMTFIPGLTAVDSEEMAASHELIEAATDPNPLQPAFQYRDTSSMWSLLGAEVADLCNGSIARNGSFVVTQSWSNSAAALGVNPCVPAPQSSPYFNVRIAGSPLRLVNPGEHLDIPVTGWSTLPTSNWNIQLLTGATFSPAPSAQIDAATLNACVTTTLHVQIPPDAPPGGEAGVLVASSRAPDDVHEWSVAFVVNGGEPGSCTIGSICIDYGPGFTPAIVMGACGSSGAYSPNACPTADRVGRCIYTTTTGGISLTFTMNFYPPETVDSARQICTSTMPNVMTMFVPD